MKIYIPTVGDNRPEAEPATI